MAEINGRILSEEEAAPKANFTHHKKKKGKKSKKRQQQLKRELAVERQKRKSEKRQWKEKSKRKAAELECDMLRQQISFLRQMYVAAMGGKNPTQLPPSLLEGTWSEVEGAV